jgi:hypothetical protein
MDFRGSGCNQARHSEPRKPIKIVSAEDGFASDFDQKKGLWLTAGQGVLLALGR